MYETCDHITDCRNNRNNYRILHLCGNVVNMVTLCSCRRHNRLVAAGLESGTLTGNETYYCGGSLRVADYDIGCHLRSGHGMETIQDAIANSCNVALMTMAESIGVDHFTRYQHIFGFGE